MPILPQSKHEKFAQFVAKGVSATQAYIKAGYAAASASQNALRLSRNERVLARIEELKATISAAVVQSSIRERTWRVRQLQDWADDMLALRAARKVLYAGQKGEGYEFEVADQASYELAIAEGCRQVEKFWVPTANESGYPKTMRHPGFPLGGESGMLVKDYRGKNAEQEIWKFDAALVDKFCLTLKQAAIEEGQWTEKREFSDASQLAETRARLHAARQRLSDAKAAALARGEAWS